MASVRPKIKPNSPLKEYSGPYKTSAQYADALRSWMMQVYHLQCFSASFPYFLASLQAQSPNYSTAETTTTTSTTTLPSTTLPSNQPNQQPPTSQAQTQNTQQQTFPTRGVEYFVPSIWKRLAAEMIDFILLFIVKLTCTYFAVDTFGLLQDLEKYDLGNFGSDFLTDYKMAINMTSELLFLELIHRIGTCVFETWCLYRGPAGLGGSTPGKHIMGLRVVRCEWVAPSLGDQVIVFPSSDLGFGRALLRAVVKNVAITFLFPVCFHIFSFQHNRTIYDVMAGSMVVEDRNRQRRVIRLN